MASLEAENQPTLAATRASAPGAPEMRELDPFKETASFGEEQGLDLEVKEDEDKEVDATYLEMLQALKYVWREYLPSFLGRISEPKAQKTSSTLCSSL